MHFIIPFRKFGPPYLGKDYSSHKSSATQSYIKCMLGLFVISVIRQTLTTGSLTSIRDRYNECVYTRGLGTPTTSQHNIFDLEKLSDFSCS